jgi:predicted nucleic acid-binding protein
LLVFELANVCPTKSRRHPDQQPALMAAFRLRGQLGGDVTVDHNSALELAAATGLTAYDASYLWVSQQFGAELVALDQQLAKAATAT